MNARAKHYLRVLIVVLILGITYIILNIATGFAIPCPIRKITGLKCGGCGISRMILNLLKGNFKESFLNNPLLFVLSPVILAILARSVYCSIKDKKLDQWVNVTTINIVILFLIYTVVRNIYGF